MKYYVLLIKRDGKWIWEHSSVKQHIVIDRYNYHKASGIHRLKLMITDRIIPELNSFQQDIAINSVVAEANTPTDRYGRII